MLRNTIFTLHFLSPNLLVSLPLQLPLSFSLSFLLHFLLFCSISPFFLPLSLPPSLPPSLPHSLTPTLPSFLLQLSFCSLPHSLTHSLPPFLSTSTFFLLTPSPSLSFFPLPSSFPLSFFPPFFVSSIFLLSYHQVPWMPLPEGSAPPGCPPGLEYLTQIDQILVHQLIEIFECKKIHLRTNPTYSGTPL